MFDPNLFVMYSRVVATSAPKPKVISLRAQKQYTLHLKNKPSPKTALNLFQLSCFTFEGGIKIFCLFYIVSASLTHETQKCSQSKLLVSLV